MSKETKQSTHKAGINVADQLAAKINWISPFDHAMLHRKIDAVAIGVKQGPLDLQTATLVLSGIFKAEGGTEETGGLRVEHADTINLLLVEQPNLTSAERMETYEITQVALKALGWTGQKNEAVVMPPGKPGVAVRWSWPYKRGGRIKVPAEA
jgi:hypothetical protein